MIFNQTYMKVHNNHTRLLSFLPAKPQIFPGLCVTYSKRYFVQIIPIAAISSRIMMGCYSTNSNFFEGINHYPQKLPLTLNHYSS